jgi:L-ascorbate metabolism protein UlaG (beta-lactamase superfamily)
MIEGIKINCHSSIKIAKDKIVYIDPFRINEVPHDADYIFITHSHYDHFSVQDILKVAKIDTIFISTEDTKSSLELMGIPEEQIIIVEPNNKYEVKGIKFETVLSYNENKKYHPKENNWVGYVIELNGNQYYIAGDTDNISEIQNIKCDIAFLPIGGEFTMNPQEAADLSNKIECKIVVPTHYAELVGTKEDLDKFIKLTNKEIKVLIEK